MAGGSPDHQSRHRNPASESEDNGRAAVTLDMAASQKLWKTLRPAATPGGPRQQRRRAGIGVGVFPPLAGSPGAVAAAAVPKDTSRGQ